MSAYVVAQIANGLILGSMYALVAIGFSMIYGIIRLINFAHGDIVMIGAFTTLAAISLFGASLPVVFVGVIAAGAMAGIVIERTAFRPMRGAPQVTGFIASLAVSIFIQNFAILTVTAQPRNFRIPDYMQTMLQIGPVGLRVIDLSIVVISVLFTVLLVAFVRFSRAGVAMRATAENLDVARLMGISINRTIMLAFAIGSTLAALSGMMWGAKYGQIDPLMGFVPGLKAFVAAVIGGVGSIAGAVVGGYVLGLAEVLFVGLLPPEYSGFRNAFVFGLLILILLVLPNGLLGRSAEERA